VTRLRLLFLRRWMNVATSFLVLTFSFSYAIFSFNPLYPYLIKTFRWSQTEAATGNAIVLLLVGVLSPFIGKAVDRFGAKNVIVAGCASVSLGFAVLSTTHGSLAGYYAACVVLGLGACASSILANSILIGPYFPSARGLMIGIVNAGIGVGGILIRWTAKLLPPIGQPVSVLEIGITHTFLVLAGLTFIPLIMASLLAENEVPSPGVGALRGRVPSTGELLRMPMFWIFGVSLFCAAHAMVGVQNLMVSYFVTEGLTPQRGAEILSIALGAAFFGKLIAGWAADRFSARTAVILSLICVAGGILLILDTPVRSNWIARIAFVFGLGYGGVFNAPPVIVFEHFGTHHVGTSLGWLYIFFGLGTATGPELAAYVFDTTHRWAPAHQIDLGFAVTALVLVLAAGRFTRSRLQTGEFLTPGPG